MIPYMRKVFLISFVVIWAVILFFFARRFIHALKVRRWGDIFLYGLALSLLVTFVEWFVFYGYALTNPQIFL